jgi:hypothetical protein
VDESGHVVGEINPFDPFHVRNPAPGCFVSVKGMWRPEDRIPTDPAGQHLAGLLIQCFASGWFHEFIRVQATAFVCWSRRQPGGHREALSPHFNGAGVSAPPPGAPLEPISSAEPRLEPKPDSTLQTRLEQLGIQCAEGANRYLD